ncbi:MAG: 3-oxoacyl-ACP reductase [Rhodospirillaceae bacterium]|nr:3-oxoacyl-ACP reductase [Rhodospirillales bacterium]
MARRALVTGGAAGIGAAIAARLQGEGFEVVIVDLSAQRLEDTARRLGMRGWVLDVSDYQAVAHTLAEIETVTGPVDVLVNNAGITRDAFIHKMTPEQWGQVIAVNLSSVFNTVRALAPGMRGRGWGRIINISSMNALRGQFGQANYAAAKAGMIGFTKSIAQELAGKGITANCIAPGFIRTEMTQAMPEEILEQERLKIPAGDLGAPADIAAAAAFLASEDARFVTGQVLSVNGGQYM